MSNIYGLPEEKLEQVRRRDTKCVYCHKEMVTPHPDKSYRDWATIEHLNHLPPWDNPNTIAICCGSCNSSRRNKTILDWFKSNYCIERNISVSTVTQPVRDYIMKYENFRD